MPLACLISSGASLLAAISLLAVSATPAAASECPNEAIRAEQHATFLPDCRAYEMVTPAFKDNAEPNRGGGGQGQLEPPRGYLAAADGERLAWVSTDNVPGAESPGLDYLSTRGPGGWSTEDPIPPQSRENGLLCSLYASIAGYGPDLSQAILADGWAQNNRTDLNGARELECGHDEPLLVPGEPEGFQNLFRRDNASRTYQLVNVTAQGAQPKDAQFVAGSADLSHVVFTSVAQLTPDAPPTIEPTSANSGNGVEDLYEWSAGTVRLVTILPAGEGGAAVEGRLPWATEWEMWKQPNIETISIASGFTHTVSEDGSRVFFEAQGNLYLREDGVTTVRLDASQGAGPGGGGRFMAATPDGSRAFFTDAAAAGLTTDTVPGSGANLYEYDAKSGHLTDLTAAADAHVQGLTGTSEDGTYVYFVADGALAAGATAGRPNLYLSHAGALAYVATLAPGNPASGAEQGDYCDSYAPCSTARVSPNGRYLAFTSIEPLTGYDNKPASAYACSVLETRNPEEPCREAFLYDAASNRLACASCDPGGAAPTGNAAIRMPILPANFTFLLYGSLSRNVTDSGQVFFDTPDGLLTRDANGKRDVYEYHEGRLHLISTGLSGDDSLFLDASQGGRDVFLLTGQQLARRDQDSNNDVYDARVGGGFTEPPPNPPCTAELCRAPATPPPALATPVTATFSGPGNPRPRHHRHHRRHRHHHHRAHHVRRAGRGGAR